MTPDSPILTTKELAKALRMSDKKVRELVQLGMPQIKLGHRTIRYDLAAVINWLNKYSNKDKNGATADRRIRRNKKKTAKPIDENDVQIKVRENVSLSRNQAQQLTQKLGKQLAKKCVDRLDNYKGSTGKRYKSDYRAILSWVIDAETKNLNPINDKTPARRVVPGHKETKSMLDKINSEIDNS